MTPVEVLELRSVRGTGGGPEKTILMGAAMADRARVHVTVCYLRQAGDPLFRIGERAAQLDVDYEEIVERRAVDRRAWQSLNELMVRRRVQVIHSHDYKTDLLALLLARRHRAAPLATAHGWTGGSLKERAFYYPGDKRLLTRFPLVFAVSSDIRNDLLRHGAAIDRVRVLLNGIDASRFRRDRAREHAARLALGLSPEHFCVGAVGRLEAQKRFDHLIEAVAQVRREQPAVRTVIAGEGAERTTLEQRISALGLGGSVVLLGHHDDVPALHHAFDVFVQSSEYEGTPNVVLEAMALGTPVIATDVGGTAEVCRPNVDGLIVRPGDVAGLASAIRDLYGDPAGRASRARSARLRVEGELSFERRLRVLEQAYVELAERRAA